MEQITRRQLNERIEREVSKQLNEAKISNMRPEIRKKLVEWFDESLTKKIIKDSIKKTFDNGVTIYSTKFKVDVKNDLGLFKNVIKKCDAEFVFMTNNENNMQRITIDYRYSIIDGGSNGIGNRFEVD